jgi:hypothetical protein
MTLTRPAGIPAKAFGSVRYGPIAPPLPPMRPARGPSWSVVGSASNDGNAPRRSTARESCLEPLLGPGRFCFADSSRDRLTLRRDRLDRAPPGQATHRTRAGLRTHITPAV